MCRYVNKDKWRVVGFYDVGWGYWVFGVNEKFVYCLVVFKVEVVGRGCRLV